jgi:Zn-dependent metalloprotease/PKD repeat protein
MKLTRLIFAISVLFSTVFSAYSQNDISITPTYEVIKYNDHSKIPIYFKPNITIPFISETITDWFVSYFEISPEFGLSLIKKEVDQFGMEHYRFQQTFQDIPIFGAVYIFHIKNGNIISMNGSAISEVKAFQESNLSESQARNSALNFVGAEKYMWEIEAEEKHLQEFFNDNKATYFPEGELVWINPNHDFKSGLLRKAYRFDIYAQSPMSRAIYFVDAANGEIIFVNPVIHHTDVNGSAKTKYSGTQGITTDSVGPNEYRLRETGRGNGIETYDLNNATNYSNAVDFTDTDNMWDNVNPEKDEIATDAHWATEMTYDFYYTNFGRNSIDDQGFKLRSYLHYSTNYANAFWNGQWMTYGDGNASMQPLVSIDIVGHEITHGLTTNTANLIYAGESGALNEGFSDIFGNMIEYYGKPSAANYDMGEDIGNPLRSMSSPKSEGNPDTYEGSYWLNTKGCVPSQTNDRCGVHINSTVMSHWFYLLAEGGGGVNDLGNSFSITGIGKEKASAIAYRSLVYYMVPSTDFLEARFYTSAAAVDLYGECSNEVEAVRKAWYAVGVGEIDKTINFEVNGSKSSCAAPLTIQFRNTSDAYATWLWKFGDGNTSQDVSPLHTYNSYGKFDVELYGFSNCGNDTVIKKEYIVIDSNMPCIYTMPSDETAASSELCQGKLFDNGGPDNDYSGSLTSTFTISPKGASQVVLFFKSFSMEGDCDCDWLYIYDGPSDQSQLIGKYSGQTLPNDGIVASTGSSITLVQFSDPYKTFSGFELDWQCITLNSPPIVDFTSDKNETCDGNIQFIEKTYNNATSWTWNFGDGQFSNDKNPVHHYVNPGYYDVKLISSNTNGADSMLIENFIHVTKPTEPAIENQYTCKSNDIEIIPKEDGTYFWFDSESSSTPLHIGDTFSLKNINSTKSYYVEREVLPVGKHTGLRDYSEASGGYYSNSNYHALIFDVYKEAELKKVTVYANGGGSRNIVLKRNDGSTAYDTNIVLQNGKNELELNFDLEVGTNFELGVNPVSNLYRNNGGVEFPMVLPNVLSIHKTTATDMGFSGYYYYFYDWVVQEKACMSNRIKFDVIPEENANADFSFELKANNLVNFTNLSDNARIFHWDFDDNSASSNEENPSYQFKLKGTYNVKLLVENSCNVDSILKEVEINQSSSINENYNTQVSVFPNPNNGIFNIKIKSQSKYVKYMIYNNLGKVVIAGDVDISQQGEINLPINLDYVSKGIYLIRVFDGNKIITEKIVFE